MDLYAQFGGVLGPFHPSFRGKICHLGYLPQYPVKEAGVISEITCHP